MKKILNLLVIVIIIFAAWSFFGEEAGAPQDVQEQNQEQQTETSETTSMEVPEDATHMLSVEQSELKWTATGVGKEHFGTIPFKSGYISVTGEVSGMLSLDTTGLLVKDLEGKMKEGLENHIKSEDFLMTESHPEATIAVKSIEPEFSKDETEYTVTVDLTMRGVTNEVSFPATVEHSDFGMIVTGSVTIDRTDWEITFRSGNVFKDLGDKLINDEVVIDLNLTLLNK